MSGLSWDLLGCDNFSSLNESFLSWHSFLHSQNTDSEFESNPIYVVFVCVCVCVCVCVAQFCLTFCDPMDCRLPDSSVHGILQTRILEWVAIPSSREFS